MERHARVHRLYRGSMYDDACAEMFHAQEDHELLEVAHDLGVEVNIRRKESPTSLGQAYPIMDNPESVETEMSHPTPSPPPPPPSTPAEPAESQGSFPALPRASSVPVFGAADGEAPKPNAAADTIDGVRRQLQLEDLAACRFRPFANQPVITRVLFQRSLRQTTLDEYSGWGLLPAKDAKAANGIEAEHPNPELKPASDGEVPQPAHTPLDPQEPI